MNDLDLVILDIAGTTVHDDGQVPEAFQTALAEYGVQVDEEQLRSVRGASKREAIKRLLPDTPGNELRSVDAYYRFCRILIARFEANVRPVEGALDCFRRLRSQNVKVALNTGFGRDITNLLLKVLDWHKEVDAVVCGDDVIQGRPAPYMIFHSMEKTGVFDVRRVANVGDTALDLKAAHYACVRWNIGVCSGAHTQEVLERDPHTHIISSVADLQSVLV